MQKSIYLVLGICCFFASLNPIYAGTTVDAESACLEAAAAQFMKVNVTNKNVFLQAMEPCGGAGPSGFADRCYEIAARRFEQASRSAAQNYQADKQACLN